MWNLKGEALLLSIVFTLPPHTIKVFIQLPRLNSATPSTLLYLCHECLEKIGRNRETEWSNYALGRRQYHALWLASAKPEKIRIGFRQNQYCISQSSLEAIQVITGF